MITRTSKIARLPKPIREQLNHRLENGQIGRTILPWLNTLPETKTLLAEFFEGKAITHQNLSEWRRGGYQEWLQQQQRLEWFDRFSENETELAQHDSAADTYEAMSRLFVFEIGQSVKALREIKNPLERTERLQNLMREFCRLQNSYNYSRHIHLDWIKCNAEPEPQIEPEEAAQPESPGAPSIARLAASSNEPANQASESIESKEARTSPSPPRSGGEGWGEVVLRAQGEHQELPNDPAAYPLPSPIVCPTKNLEPKTPNPSPSTSAFQSIPTPSPTTPARKYNAYYTPRRSLSRSIEG